MNYQFNSFVNRREAEELKEMIFKRAKERSEAMTTDFQADVMTIARESFVSNHNPFSQIVNGTEDKTVISTPQAEKEEKEIKTSPLHEFVEKAEKAESKTDSVGFRPRNLYTGATTQNKLIKEQMAAIQVENAMEEAREGLASRKSFMGALEFLNSKAAISALKTRADKFEALA